MFFQEEGLKLLSELRRRYAGVISVNDFDVLANDRIHITAFNIKSVETIAKFYDFVSEMCNENLLFFVDDGLNGPRGLFEVFEVSKLPEVFLEFGEGTHICFPRSFSFVLVNGRHNMFIGIGSAIPWIEDFEARYGGALTL